MEIENVTAGRKWPVAHEKLEKIPELERELRASLERIEHWQESREQREATRLTVQKTNEICNRLQAQYEKLQSEFERVSKLTPSNSTDPNQSIFRGIGSKSNRIGSNPVGPNPVGSNPIGLNPTQFNPVQWIPIPWNPIRWDPIQWS